MDFKFTHYFEVDLDTFERVWSEPACIDALVAGMPNLESRELLEEKEEGGVLKRKVRYMGCGQVPKIARKVIKPHMLSWVEETVFDKNNHTYEFRCIPHYFADRIENGGKCRLIQDGKNRTRREIEGYFNIRLPSLTRKMAERLLMRYVKDNMEKEAGIMNEYIRKTAGSA